MKKIVLLCIVTFFLASTHVFSAEEKKKGKYFQKWGKKTSTSSASQSTKNETIKTKKNGKYFQKWGKRTSTSSASQATKAEKKINRNIVRDEMNHNVLFYTGTFDTIDKEGDDKTSLVGIEHKNKDLFRDTWIGRFSPTTGALVTKKSSIYLYTGIEADYNFGRVSISPSFAPGYYEAGDGKNLGSALEFKSEVKIGLDLFKNSKLGYSYSHISNNDWGDVNPGSDNQSITFSKKY